MSKMSSSPLEPKAASSSARQKWDHRYSGFAPQERRRPTPFVMSCLPQLPVEGLALDIAAGAGRHSLALARHGLQVDAVDISWQGLQLAHQRASKAQFIPGQIQFIVADIEQTWPLRCQYDVILVSFFLHRPLFPIIKSCLLPGGWLIYETFTVEQLNQPDRHPRLARPDFFLKPGELQNAFSDFEILLYDEGIHNGRATAQLLAQKP